MRPIDFQDPPPQTICAPFSAFPAWDPDTPYPALFANLGDYAGCENGVVSPTTADEVMRESLKILEDLNIVGVTTGPARSSGIHIGTGPPGSPYLGFAHYRGRMHSPLSLEEPLRRHPGLRLYVMHAGWPMLDDTLALRHHSQ